MFWTCVNRQGFVVRWRTTPRCQAHSTEARSFSKKFRTAVHPRITGVPTGLSGTSRRSGSRKNSREHRIAFGDDLEKFVLSLGRGVGEMYRRKLLLSTVPDRPARRGTRAKSAAGQRGPEKTLAQFEIGGLTSPGASAWTARILLGAAWRSGYAGGYENRTHRTGPHGERHGAEPASRGLRADCLQSQPRKSRSACGRRRASREFAGGSSARGGSGDDDGGGRSGSGRGCLWREWNCLNVATRLCSLVAQHHQYGHGSPVDRRTCRAQTGIPQRSSLWPAGSSGTQNFAGGRGRARRPRRALPAAV